MTPDATLPKIGVVIIGVNVQRYIADCIESVHAADYPRTLVEIVYVDGGSTDNTVNIAKAHGARVVLSEDEHPTPSGDRNAGWRGLNAPYILFLDSDTTLDPGFLKRALSEIKNQVAAVCGHRQERHPYRNLYHMIAAMEWRDEIGLCRYFGGDVLIRRDALEKTNGYDESLWGGEDPDLSYRVRQLGFQVIRLDVPMTTHDINMSTFRQYFKRAHRTGYNYISVCLRHLRNPEKMWLSEIIRIVYKALLPVLLIIFGIAFGYPMTGLLLALVIYFRPLLAFSRLKEEYRENNKNTFIYVIHSAVVVYPQFLGILRYLYGVILGRPLQNKSKTPSPH